MLIFITFLFYFFTEIVLEKDKKISAILKNKAQQL
ncbi:hypothetical protein SAMN05192550_1298 [Flavobacterium glycines]|uniref:Uncharacterized protein n=1 Tax=Flavobacterium glycines TaxID=551990 RepID=A0A1G8PYI4_9FLAO|nr:hypothetical protein SAMN05192550_1298 [Flavobacterium glycines]